MLGYPSNTTRHQQHARFYKTIDQIAIKPCSKTCDLLQWRNQLVSITNTVENHSIITMIATFPLNNSETHSHSIINSSYRVELSIQYKEVATILPKLINMEIKPHYAKLVLLLDDTIT
jgi:hypothetical protein